jgi:uncharacterized ion transporter superfamily protein YfcC
MTNASEPAKSGFRFPSSVTTLAIVMVLVWVAALFIPLMAALGYDRLATAAMIIVGATTGVMAGTLNPFSIGLPPARRGSVSATASSCGSSYGCC